ncbi:50S ribosomal protein P1 [archaeon]|nr:50S ribosomal protein P1 [archaeon]|tara:strand:+ start:5407 stop:5715 length:309 start_codon:yes stop_codon:yes gene_type:complete
MEYIHAVLLLNKLGKEVNEASVKKVLEAAGATPDDGRIKALLSAIDGVNITDVIKDASVPAAAAPAQSSGEAKEESKEEKKEDKEEKKTAEENASGLASLFG